ncbi:MAG: hypothetical protein JWO38_2346 [Gemmataceae bacterium]|nr:hypothetical protein [Gemmataceae bacterium]
MSILVTPGSGATAAADVVGTPHAPSTGENVQWVGIALGTLGSPTPVGPTNPVPTQNGDGVNLQKSASAANLATKTGINAALVAPPGCWAVTSNPGANTQASASQAAGGAGVRHVCTGLSFSIASGGTAPTAAQLVVNLRDGATGAGTVLHSWTIAIPATTGAFNSFEMVGLNIVGSANTAMTLEFAAAGGANTYEACNLTGYDVS